MGWGDVYNGIWNHNIIEDMVTLTYLYFLKAPLAQLVSCMIESSLLAFLTQTVCVFS